MSLFKFFMDFVYLDLVLRSDTGGLQLDSSKKFVLKIFVFLLVLFKFSECVRYRAMKWIWVTRLVKSHSEPGPQSLIWGAELKWTLLDFKYWFLVKYSALFIMRTNIYAINFNVFWFLTLHHFCTTPMEWLPFGICPCQGQIEKLCPTKWGNMYSNGDEAEPSSQRGWSCVVGHQLGCGMSIVRLEPVNIQNCLIRPQQPDQPSLWSQLSVHRQTQNNFQPDSNKG